MNLKFHIYIATPKEDASEVFLTKSRRILEGTSCNCIINNSTGLCQLYNQILKSVPWTESDRIIFMHDDLELHDLFWRKKLIEAHKKYDVVGLAGGEFSLFPEIAMWHLMGRREKFSGSMTHTRLNKTWINIYGRQGESVNLLDGVFLSVNPTKLREKNVFFDEDFLFHHYDLSFSYRCQEADIKMGTPDHPIYVVHHGLGEPDKNWNESNRLFKSKYYPK